MKLWRHGKDKRLREVITTVAIVGFVVGNPATAAYAQVPIPASDQAVAAYFATLGLKKQPAIGGQASPRLAMRSVDGASSPAPEIVGEPGGTPAARSTSGAAPAEPLLPKEVEKEASSRPDHPVAEKATALSANQISGPGATVPTKPLGGSAAADVVRIKPTARGISWNDGAEEARVELAQVVDSKATTIEAQSGSSTAAPSPVSAGTSGQKPSAPVQPSAASSAPTDDILELEQRYQETVSGFRDIEDAEPREAPRAAGSSAQQASPTKGPAKSDSTEYAPVAGSGSLMNRAPRVDGAASGAGRDGSTNFIQIRNSRSPKRGINVNAEVPSVRHVTMSPASKKFGGDDVEIVISPIFDVMVQMPEAVEYFKSSHQSLVVQSVNSQPNLLTLKLLPTAVDNPVPISLHVVDATQQIYTFTVIGTSPDLAWEYPKTIIVNRRVAQKTTIGHKNPMSVVDAMDIDDAVQIVVGDIPKTSEYAVDFISGRYMHHAGYAQYAFRVSRKDQGKIALRDLKFTIWANDRRLDGGNAYTTSRTVEWTIEPILTSRETRRRGYDTLRVFVQIRASILDLEEWANAFITLSDSAGFTRFDFTPIIRGFRAPPGEAGGEQDEASED